MRDFREVEPGVWSVLDGTRAFEIRKAAGDIRVNSRTVEPPVADPRAWQPRTAGTATTGLGHIKAPMPGKVVRVLAAVGDQVRKSQGVIVVEAMKMQNELKSPRDGRVTAIAVQEHDTVNAGAVLVTIE